MSVRKFSPSDDVAARSQRLPAGRTSADGRGAMTGELYDQHATAAYRFALHLTGSRCDADQVVRRAFLAVHQALARGERAAASRAWILRAVKREAGAAAGPAVVGSAASRLQNFDAVRTTLLEFPEPEHHAFVLRHWSGLVDREIADVLATSPAGVETLLFRARSKLAGERDLAIACQTVRIRLSMDQPMSAADDEHMQGCSGCRTARERLAQVAGIAGVLALAPSVGVASAMAASVPGFAAGSVTAGSGTGAAMVGAAAKAGLAVKAAVAVVAIGASVAVVHAHRHEIVAGVTNVLERVVPQSGGQRPARSQTSTPVTPGASRAPAAQPGGSGGSTHRPPRIPPHRPTSGGNAHRPGTAGGGRPSRHPSHPSRPPRAGVAPPATSGSRKPTGGRPTPPTHSTGSGTGGSGMSHQPSRVPLHLPHP